MIDRRVIEFIEEHHVMTVAAAYEDDLWCANAFYAFFEKESSFIITSEKETRHALLFKKNSCVTGSIMLETEHVGLIRGLQFRATVQECDNSFFDKYKLIYLKRFPYAILKGGEVWLLKLDEIKYTDNRLGFGKKILWKK
ncbi:MAG: hypothetical protein WCR82_02645 [Bacteroidales bacterium]|jgi:hypothetical protein